MIEKSILQRHLTESEGKKIFEFYQVKFIDYDLGDVAGNAIGHKQKSLQFWTKEEFDRFITSIAPSDEYYVVFNTLYYTGMRLGELQALTSSDIDFDTNTINVNKTYKVLNGKELITTPKTKKDVRKIIIPQFLSDMLKSYIERLYKNSKTDRIFFQSQTDIARHLKIGAEAASVTPIRIHDLRHSQFYQVKFIDYDLGYISFNVLIHLFGQRTLAKALSVNSIYNEICYNGQIYGNICLYDRCLEIHNRIFETPIILPPEKDLPQFDIETDKIKSPRKRKNSNNNCAGAT